MKFFLTRRFLVQGLGQIGRRHALTAACWPSDVSPQPAEPTVLLTETLTRALNTKPPAARLAEAASEALGLVAVGLYPHPDATLVRASLLRASSAKLLELNLTVGRALTLLAAGELSTAVDAALPVPEADEAAASTAPVEAWEAASPHIQALLTTIFEEKATSYQAADRQAACVWLTVIANELGAAPMVQAALPRMQHVLLDSLAEGDEILQEMASRGLSVCYELGTPKMKEELVQALVDALTTGHRAQVSLPSYTLPILMEVESGKGRKKCAKEDTRKGCS